ncbi:hypothetical protein HOLleu_15529 [Holothuria leucospilota]|uniref:Uncharacterized protein n=1 Tax=Holothuria leucospilota TaxID=206669 RepID=A0A9Q1HDC3_HOLLE|nr:hypothetical protein HOLleu_15529 [Holothuria leucospilota]
MFPDSNIAAKYGSRRTKTTAIARTLGTDTKDNAAVMMGPQRGVASFVKRENENVFILGCPCHLIHLAAEKGASQLPFSPVSLLIPIFYYLAKSKKSLNRFLEQWVALEQYFKEEAQGEMKRKNIPQVQKPKKSLSAAKDSSKSKQNFPEKSLKSVVKYFITVCDYIVQKLPLRDELLNHAKVANPSKRLEMSFTSVSFFVKRFHIMKDKLDELEIEFAHYQVENIPTELLQQKRVDSTWVALSHLKDESSGEFKYANLSTFFA